MIKIFCENKNMLSENQSGLDVLSSEYLMFSYENNNVKIPIWLESAFSDYESIYNDDDSISILNISYENVINCIESFYWVSKWYDLVVSDGILTPETIFLPISKINELDSLIKFLGRAFVRLDSASSKNIIYHINDSKVYNDLYSSERTKHLLKCPNENLLIILKICMKYDVLCVREL